ncbi:DeoR family transcriptional regulator of aga operon [Mycetocola sp. BIGb0189]|uniref:DeoR/GlpR family DNA-binding transcription regulator n=1 Tax=Mycetocola sp. BIGb0189 TaxID=2940604 RepID=UPI002167497F|nr:DeoR/GlpR family DNA-binding transcription regulator [Mycetocola sp. BIGb0189]MCS4277820.1 DeoR family transcriptional regulator of aga operon [Mycetocola sp. BIGb0189]
MTTQQRLNRLLDFVGERGNVSIAEIVAEFEVSAATARRDLTTLAEQRLVTRTHGGASALSTGYELPLQYKIALQAEAKIAIARATAALIPTGATVGINGGTTTTEVARQLAKSERFVREDGEPGLTLVTNALNIAYELSLRRNVKITVTGGVARAQSYELVGPLVRDTLTEFALDVVVLGVDGLGPKFGATTVHESEAEVSRIFAEVGARVIVVADSTKILRSTFARICPLDVIDVLVTDQPLDPEIAGQFAAAGVEVVVATHESEA